MNKQSRNNKNKKYSKSRKSRRTKPRKTKLRKTKKSRKSRQSKKLKQRKSTEVRYDNNKVRTALSKKMIKLVRGGGMFSNVYSNKLQNKFLKFFDNLMSTSSVKSVNEPNGQSYNSEFREFNDSPPRA